MNHTDYCLFLDNQGQCCLIVYSASSGGTALSVDATCCEVRSCAAASVGVHLTH